MASEAWRWRRPWSSGWKLGWKLEARLKQRSRYWRCNAVTWTEQSRTLHVSFLARYLPTYLPVDTLLGHHIPLRPARRRTSLRGEHQPGHVHVGECALGSTDPGTARSHDTTRLHGATRHNPTDVTCCSEASRQPRRHAREQRATKVPWARIDEANHLYTRQGRTEQSKAGQGRSA